MEKRISKGCYSELVMRNRNSFFTLLELLVAIAIISILAGLLLPALNKARTKAQAISCANKLKTFGTYESFYNNDYDGWILPTTYGGATRTWIQLMWCYVAPGNSIANCPYPGDTASMAKMSLYVCPGEPLAFGGYKLGQWTYTHYFRNKILGAAASSDSTRAKRACFKKSGDITNPSVAASMTDSIAKDSENFEVHSQFYNNGRHGGTNTKSSAASSALYVNGTSNLLCMDGHVQSVRYMELLYPNGGDWAITGIRDTSK